MPKDYGELNFDKIFDKMEQMADKIIKSGAKVESIAEDAGGQVGESFVDSMGRGLDEATNKIAASSVKITKAFRELAKRITNQKDIFNISLGGKNVVLDIDFSDIDINSADFQRKIDEVFKKFKVDNSIEFDSKTAEKQFKDMLGLHVKYTDKLSKLQNQSTKLTKPEHIKANVQEQLAMIDGLKEIQRVLDQTSGMSVSLPHVYSSSTKDLRTIIETLDRVQKGEEKVGKQHDTNVAKIKKENKELKERNKILEEKVGPIEGEQVPSARKPRVKKTKQSVDVEAKTIEETSAIKAKSNEQTVIAEQTQLNITKEELKVEKEITKEKEKQYGYHAGKFRDDGFRAENLWQSTPGRSTGFYGTGTYMTDKTHLKEITTGQYGKRPLNVIDPDMYNLFDATNDKTADQLHQFLKRVTNKAFGGKGENIKSLYSEFKALFPKEQVITYEDFKILAGELQQYVKDNKDNYNKSKYMDSVSTKFMKNFGYEGVDTRGTKYADTTYGTVIYDLKEESVVLKEITNEMQKQEIIAGNIASVVEKRVNTPGRVQGDVNQTTQQQVEQTQGVVRLVDNYGSSLDEVNNKLIQGTKLLNEQGQIIRLFHNSPDVFDKFDTSKSGTRQGAKLGKGNYLALKQDSKYNSPEFGRYQTQWYANVEKIFDSDKDTLSQEQINHIIDNFLSGASDNIKNLLSKSQGKYISNVVQYVAKQVGVQAVDIWSSLGYDAVKQDDQINIFDSSKIHRANDAVLDIGTDEFDKLRKMQDEARAERINISRKENQIKELQNNSGGRNIDKEIQAIQDNITERQNILNSLTQQINEQQIVVDEIIQRYINGQSNSHKHEQMSMFPEKGVQSRPSSKKNQKKTKEAPQGTQMTIDDIVPKSAEDTTPKVEDEAKAFDKVGEAADKAAKKKGKFADANKKVADSTTPSIKGLKDEAGALDEVGEKTKTAWSTTRPGVKSIPLVETSDTLDNFNLPVDYMGEKGQDAVQMFAKLKSEIEEMTGKPVIIDFISDVNDEGQLEAVGATLKYVNEEAGVTVKQFYDVERNLDGVLVATQSHEKATIAATKAAKSFNTEMQQKLALEQIKTLESQMGSLELDLSEVKKAASAINDKASLENFNLALRSAKEQAKQLKSELKGQNTLDTIASMERALLTLPSRLDEVQRRLNALGDVDGADTIDDVLRSINQEYQRFLSSSDSDEKVKLFRSLTSSMVWVNAEMRNLSGQASEAKRQETAVEKEELAKQKAARESYINWWKTTLNAQDEADAYEKSLLERERKEKEAEERIIAARKKKEEEYNAWWQKALYDKERAPNLKYGKTTANSAQRKLEATEGAVDALGVTNPEVLSKMDAYKSKVNEVLKLRAQFESNPHAAEDSTLVRQFQKAAIEAENARRGIKAVIDEEQKMMQMSDEQGFEPVPLSADQILNLKGTMESLVQTTAKGRVEIKGWNDDNTKMYYTVTDSKGAVQEMTMALGRGTNRLYQYRTATKETGTLIQQIFKGIKTKAKELLSFVIGGGSVYKVIELLRQGIQYVREIDLALTELKKVTDETEEEYDQFLQTAAKTGARLGSTISAVTEATATFAKLGYEIEQATEMAEAAIVYKNVGDNIASTEDAADSIISTMKGFRLEASESMEIVDRFNEVGNRFAITSQGIGEALRLSASALSEGGNSLDESIGLITAANEVVNDPSSVGTALKTLTLRLRGSKTELEEMGEDVSDMATTTSALQAKLLALTGGQVDIMLDENTFKNSTQILREMASAWEDMNDIQRASALELMGGKRQANVLSALIQNFDTVESVIETSANSAGSALEENERYLDSIQGKIDQFNNAMQAMWSNTLDSDMVKGFVSLGTEIIKIIDKIGLLNTALIALATYSMIKNKMGPIAFLGGISDLIRDVVGKAGGFIGSLTGMTAATSAYTAETLEASVANGTLSASEAASIATKSGLALATTNLTAAEATEMLMSAGVAKADALAMVAKLGLTSSTQALSLADIQAAVSSGALTTAQGAQIASALGLTAANTGLTASFMALWTALWPILAVMAGIAAIYGVVKLFDALIVSAEEASEQLEETKNKISDLESELESLQTELDEAREKIAELTALPYLSLTQQEDLDRLEREVELLERQIALKERQLAIEEANLVNDAETAIEKNWYKSGAYDLTSDGKVQKDRWFTWGNSGSDVVSRSIDRYNEEADRIKELEDALLNWDDADTETKEDYTFLYGSKDELINEIKAAEAHQTEIASSIEEFFNDPVYAGLEYGMSDEIDAFLDDFNNAQLKWEKALYGDNSTSSVIESLWGPNASEEMKAVKSEIDKIMAEDGDWVSEDEKWQSKNDAIKAYIESLDETADGYHQLDYVINDLGVTAQDISDYFTVLNGAFNSNTIEGITQQYAKAEEVMSALKNMSNGTFTFEGQSYNWDEFFSQDDQGKFKARVDKFAEILKGMDNDTRETFINIVESAANAAGDLSQIDWNQAISKLDLAGIDKTFELLNNEFEALNNEMFAGAADEINGLIDTVSELQAALEDVAGTMDLLHTAQTQMNGSGRVSVKTALELMQTTEDWDKVLEITNGTIRLRQGAEEHLIQTELTAIKTQLHYAWTTAKARYETALAAQGELDYADNSTTVMTAESIKAEAIGRVSAVVVSLGAAMDKLVAGEWGSVFSTFGETYKTATATVVQDAQQYKTTLGELRDNAAKQKQLYDTFSSIDDPAKFMENYDFNETPGDKYDDDKKTKEEEIEDGWERLVAKYDNQLALLSNERDLIQAEIDKAEARGGKASAKYYEDLKRNAEAEKAILIQKKAAMEQYLAANENAIDQDTWTDYNNEINETAVAIKECEQNTIEWAEAIREIDLHYFEQIADEVSRLSDELDFVNSLLEDEEVADENGNWSSAALTRMGMYTNQMEEAATRTAMYQDEIDKLNESYAKGELSEEQYQESLSDLVGGQQDAIRSYEDAKDSIVELNEARIDAIREGIEKEIEAYQDLIDVQKEELDAARDLHDFRKQIAGETKNIQELERRIASLSGSTAASDIAERRKLQAELNEARSNLDDTYYNHSLDAQSNALDEESDAYTKSKEKYIEQLEEQLKDTKTLIQNSIMDVLFNADLVYTELNILADTYGITLSDELTQPWKDASAQAIAWKDELQESMTAGEYAALIGEGGAITVFANGVATKLQGSWNKAQTAAANYAGYLTGAELKNKFTNTLTGFGNQIQTIIDKWDGVKAAADAAYAAQTRTPTVGGNPNVGGDGNGDGSGYAPPYAPPYTPSGETPETPAQPEKPKELTEAQKIAAKIVRFGSAQGRGMNAGKKGDNGVITWNGKEYNVQNSGNSFGKGTPLYKAAVDHLKFGDRQIFGYKGQIYGYLDGAIQEIEGRFWSKKGYNDFVAGVKANYSAFAKGTTGTTRDQWAITDEPQFGDELVLVPGKDGNLSFMRKGTGVVPADMTQKLFELAQIPTSDLMKKNITAIVPDITKNDISNQFNFDSLVHVDHCDQNTLKDLEKMVDNKINDFSKQMNYSLKKFAR